MARRACHEHLHLLPVRSIRTIRAARKVTAAEPPSVYDAPGGLGAPAAAAAAAAAAALREGASVAVEAECGEWVKLREAVDGRRWVELDAFLAG